MGHSALSHHLGMPTSVATIVLIYNISLNASHMKFDQLIVKKL